MFGPLAWDMWFREIHSDPTTIREKNRSKKALGVFLTTLQSNPVFSVSHTTQHRNPPALVHDYMQINFSSTTSHKVRVLFVNWGSMCADIFRTGDNESGQPLAPLQIQTVKSEDRVSVFSKTRSFTKESIL